MSYPETGFSIIGKSFGVAALLLFSAFANAGVLSAVNDSFTEMVLLADGNVDDNGNMNDQAGQDLTATLTFTLEAIDLLANTIDLRVDAVNTTADQGKEVGLLAYGFGIDPDANSVAFWNDDGDADAFVDAEMGTFRNFPDKDYIEISGYTGRGANRTLREGEIDSMLLRLGFSDLVGGETFDINPVNVWFQTYNKSFQLIAEEVSNPVPAPNGLPLVLLGLMMAGLGVYRRRR